MTAQVYKTTSHTKGSMQRDGSSLVLHPQGGLSNVVESHLKEYFEAHKEAHLPSDLYDIIMGEIEPPLFITTLKIAKGNQKKAAEILGINRNTLKRKLDHYGILPCGD